MNCPETGLPLGGVLPEMALPHFPARWQAVLWRNWGLVTPSRLASVLKTTPENLARAAVALGLGEAASESTERLWLTRGYITLIRQNWHLLPYAQLLTLLGWSANRLAYALKEDDFLWNKLGRSKPQTAPVTWAALTSEEERRTAVLRQEIESALGGAPTPPAVRPFDFLKDYGRQSPGQRPTNRSSFGLRLVYSYSAVYGDPLLDPDLDPFPDGMLADLAANGINGVWLQGVLYTLVPWLGDTPCSRGHETRIRNLNALVEKARRHGIGVYLYLNEPRGMPSEFYDLHPDWKGPLQEETGLHCMCVTNTDVLEKLQAGVRDLFRKAPGLAGVFTITCSENLTHCHSKENLSPAPCPRCAGRDTGEMIAAVNNRIAAGVHAAKPEADVIAWNWSWFEDWWKTAIDRLRPDVRLMCTSETYLATEAMGIQGLVGDYSMSKVGPGELARGMWRRAHRRGLDILAKVQLNNTWECSAVPYLPVPFLVKRHLRNLEREGINGLMVAWTLGGYPGGNLRLVDAEPEELAREWFGEEAADTVVAAWRRFSDAFAEFPLHGCPCLYGGPQNYGPMNLLFAEPTGRAATMLGFPYDDLEKWRGRHFPPEVFEEQFRKLSEGWREGLSTLEAAVRLVPEAKQPAVRDLWNVAEAAGCHFRSTYLQIRFIRLRDASPRAARTEELLRLIAQEADLARVLLDIVRRDSRIGFEASNHYYYTENTLKEKILNCAHLTTCLRDRS